MKGLPVLPMSLGFRQTLYSFSLPAMSVGSLRVSVPVLRAMEPGMEWPVCSDESGSLLCLPSRRSFRGIFPSYASPLQSSFLTILLLLMPAVACFVTRVDRDQVCGSSRWIENIRLRGFPLTNTG